MTNPLQHLIDAPLANASRTNLPHGRLPAKRDTRPANDPDARRQIEAQRKAAHNKKIEELYDYYATTDVPIERIAEHMGIRHTVQVGTTKDEKPIFKKVPDVEKVRRNIEARRAASRP